MAKKVINITGTPGKKYDLDVIANTNTRTDSSAPLVAQKWEWYDTADTSDPHSKPYPNDLVEGQIFFVKKVTKNNEN